MKHILCIVGASGTGKTTLAKALKERYGYNVIESYTTRKPRFDDELGHTFTDVEEYKKHKSEDIVIADTFYAGNYYWAIKEQIKDGVNVYVIDPEGLRSLIDNNNNEYGIVGVFLYASEEDVLKRLTERDGEEKAKKRIAFDKAAFAMTLCDIAFNTSVASVEEIVNIFNYNE